MTTITSVKPSAPAVDPDVVDARQRRRAQSPYGCDSPDREHHSRETPGHCYEQAFREHLSHEAAAWCPQRGAHCELETSSRRPREHEIGDVRAGDQEHEAHCAQQKIERA